MSIMAKNLSNSANLKASAGVSSILEERILESAPKSNLEETGRVMSTGGGSLETKYKRKDSGLTWDGTFRNLPLAGRCLKNLNIFSIHTFHAFPIIDYLNNIKVAENDSRIPDYRSVFSEIKKLLKNDEDEEELANDMKNKANFASAESYKHRAANVKDRQVRLDRQVGFVFHKIILLLLFKHS